MLKRFAVLVSLVHVAMASLFGQTIEPILSVRTDRKVVAFTFDDGPHAQITPKLLDLFDQVEGKATFFNMGKNLNSNREVAAEVLHRGHEIGNHTLNHKRLPELSDSVQVWNEIKGFQELYNKELGYRPVLFRAPFLKYGPSVNSILTALKLQPVNGAVYARDAKKNVNPKDIIDRVSGEVRPGVVILCHEREHTVNALKTLLPQLKRAGYEFVTVSDLLKYQTGEQEKSFSLKKNHSKGETGMVAANDPAINITGSNYLRMDGDLMVFPRHSASLLAMSNRESKISAQKAQTTTGIIISFKTASPKIVMHFQRLDGQNRGSVFGVFQNGSLVDAARFKKTDSPEICFELESTKPGQEVLYEITLPNWSNVAFGGMELTHGFALNNYTPESKPIYVAYGNSITHGTGQQATYQTYPFGVSRSMNWELYNVAVGGGQTSIAMAQMIRDDFEHIDYMSILIGYNDYNGAGISAQEYGVRLHAFLKTIREKHRGTKLFCITPTYTTTIVSRKSGVAMTEFRNTMTQVVEELQGKGDENLFLIRGEEISKKEDLNDPVHLNVKGAKSFGELLSKKMKKIITKTKK